MTANHYEIRFSGTGGQGMMLMGDVMAQAAGITDGKEVVLLKSYGPEARGGACRSELIIDTAPISYPALVRPDFVLAMSQQAADSYTKDMDPETGVLLIDSDLVKNHPGIKHIYALPLTAIANKVTGKAITANVVALGAISVLSSAVEEEGILKAVLERFPEKLQNMNRAAFAAGVEAAKGVQ